MSDQVVELKEVGEGILQLKMQDKVHKNTFTEPMIDGLIQSFETIKNMTQYKVVIFTGYDSYFSSGGTQEALFSLSEGKGKFTDAALYSLALNCPIPVISAMQGHGIGGGFVMGMFSDFVILSRESIYTANFMKYGFTPGMGSTFILPKKLGLSLSEEMMISAKTYYGEELQGRGVPFPVLPRKDVMDYAMNLAKTIAEKPRESLVVLKDHLIGDLRKELPKAIELEVKMHDLTFHKPEVKERIEASFGR
ncbi:enoyl-CoA hydratase/isomerase family protein [Paraneptunicella aestuarii]|uniref:polyketide synthase n=1 Tax=Paraneptunicella aestuarii TaxID=2831148 RepID=UPI001E41F2DD|nr:polyketide synthase [Paraneptunicella aestuarii]UAA37175.1 enoyl-CoA hydratase/isomerase family protein [Paraneptunicella aestuarii]